MTFDLSQIQPCLILFSVARGFYWKTSVTDSLGYQSLEDFFKTSETQGGGTAPVLSLFLVIITCYTAGCCHSSFILVNHHHVFLSWSKLWTQKGISVTTLSMKNNLIVRLTWFDLYMTLMKATSQSCSLNNMCCWNFDVFKMWTLISIKFFKSHNLQWEQATFFLNHHTSWFWIEGCVLRCVHSCVKPHKNQLRAQKERAMAGNQFLLKFSQLSVDSNLFL